ncbi:MAG TPA: hypothetical protein DCR93_19840 [Cytophagales bacterium]|nr:hypothetical protein [Cytophagales bacterium]HAP61652.1 hypothetical protein [Cytophagales bacterium]
MHSRVIRVSLMRYFKQFGEAEMVFFTPQGLMYSQEEFEKAIEKEGPDNLRMVTRRELFHLQVAV